MIRRNISPFLKLVLTASLFAVNAFAGSQGTTLAVTKTAVATIEETDTYDWFLEKNRNPPQLPIVTIRQGKSDMFHFSIAATRSGPVITSTSSGVTGQICVENTGSVATQGLYITDQLEENIASVWEPINGIVIVPGVTEVASGTTACFNYSVSYDLQLNHTYRNHAIVYIDNYASFEGTTHSTDVWHEFTATIALTEINKSMDFTDAVTCPAGFTCNPLAMAQTLTGTWSTILDIAVTNSSHVCGDTVRLLNDAYLKTIADADYAHSNAFIDIYTGACRTPDR